jgi:GT2 family glycosyltransferase
LFFGDLAFAIMGRVTIRPEPARLAVVIVNYQAYDELSNCLGSLERIGEPVSVVVIDHASDASAADDLSRKFPDVRLVRMTENQGFASGINQGVCATSAPLLLLLNPDCVLEPLGWRMLLDWMDRHRDVGVVGPRISNADGTVQHSARRFPDITTAVAGRSSWLTRVAPGNRLSRRNLPFQQARPSTVTDVDWVSGACMLVRRSAFEAVGGMDGGFFLYWEDADFCRRLKYAGFRTVYFPEAAVTHVGGRSSRHAAHSSIEAFHESAYRLFRKHAGPLGRVLAPAVFVTLRVRLAVMKQLVRRRPHAD